MSHGDPLDSMAEALFRAARRERAQGQALERTLSAVVAAHRRRPLRRALLGFGGAMALAAAAALVLRGGPSAQSIQAEHLVPKHAVESAAASDDAAELRVGRAPAVNSTTLEEETAMLESARSELAAGKPESALSFLDRYDRVSGGHLTAQATLLRIQVLAKSGRASLAAKLAQRFVDSDPKGPLAEQARSYIPKQ